MTGAAFIVKAADEIAGLTSLVPRREDAVAGSTSYVGTATGTVSNLDLTFNEKRYIKVVSQDGTSSAIHEVIIIGTDSTPMVDKVTVNGDAATAPAAVGDSYTYLNVLPDASSVVVGVKTVSSSHFVQIADGPITAGGYAEYTYEMALTEMNTAEPIPFRLYKSAYGNPTYEGSLYLERLGDEYKLNVKVDGDEVRTRRPDGSYVHYVDGTATEALVSAIAAASANHYVEISGLNNQGGTVTSSNISNTSI